MAGPRQPASDVADAAEAIRRAEDLIGGVDRGRLLQHLDQLREFIEELSRLTVDLRIARLRLQRSLPGVSDPDRTPVQGISSASIPKVTPEK